jgi:hypothetical protein
MRRSMGLLVAGFDYAAVDPGEFNDWYDSEHIPERRRTPGFINAERWLGVENEQISIATYDLESFAVLESPGYRAIAGENLSPWSKRIVGKCRRVFRFDGEQMNPGDRCAPDGAAALLLVAMNVEPAAEAELNEWYDTEHLPRLATVPGCLAARRFRGHAGTHRYLALYHLAAPDVAASKAWEAAAVTPWTVKLRPATSDRLRLVLRPYRR